MSKKQSVIILLLFISFLSFSVSKTKAQQDEIETLIKEVSADTQKGAIFGYTYQMKFSYNRRGRLGTGRRFSRLYEAIIPTRFSMKQTYTHPLLLTYDSERVITNYDVEFMRNRLVEEIERAEREAEANPNEQPGRKDGGYWTIGFRAGDKGVKIDIIQLLENSNFSNMHKTESGGRKIVSLDFSPKTDTKFDTAISYLGKIEGKIWIDEADKRIMKIEGFPLGTFATVKELPVGERQAKTVFLFAQTRVAEGFWFPQDVVVDFTKNPEIFDTVKVEFTFDKYKKSTTEVRSSRMESPKEAETVEKAEKPKEDNQKEDNQKEDNRQKDQ